MESFLASVKKVYIKYDDKWPKYPMSGSAIKDYTKFYTIIKNSQKTILDFWVQLNLLEILL
jgi:hypothetical protein